MAGWIPASSSSSSSPSSSSSSSPSLPASYSVTSRRVPSGPTTPTHGVRRITSEGNVLGEPTVPRGEDNGRWEWYRSLVARWVHREQVPPAAHEASSSRAATVLPQLPYSLERVVAAVVSLVDRARAEIRNLTGAVTGLLGRMANAEQRLHQLEEDSRQAEEREAERIVQTSDTYYIASHNSEIIASLVARVTELERERGIVPAAGPVVEPAEEPIEEPAAEAEEDVEEEPEEDSDEDSEEDSDEEMSEATTGQDSN